MIGDRLGKWIIHRELGRGGMGRIFLAQDEMTGQKAALKILAGELAQEGGFLHRFHLEIETLKKLDHPGVVKFYESGHENDLYFYAMEFVDGQSYETIVEARGRLPWNEVLDMARQVAPALRHVHDHGIIHRDLKPANVLCSVDGVVKLSDFGIAKVFASAHLTAAGGVVGTAEFLSPEQASGKNVGRRSDIYSLGVVLYTLLTGRPPFTGKGHLDLLHKHRYAIPDRPQKYVPDLPYEIDELVMQMLEKDPDHRPHDCFVLSKQLEAIHRRLEAKGQQTLVANRQEGTMAEHGVDLTEIPSGSPGPATLMSRLMREELERQQRGGPIQRFLNRPWVVVTLLALCLGILVWTFWPYSQEQLYEHGKGLMETGQLVEMERAWRDYLEPLATRFPDHPYQDELAAFKQQLENARSPQPSEAQRFYALGETLRQQGDRAGARQLWQNVVDVFQQVEEEKEWVRKAERGLTDLDKEAADGERWTSVRAALNRATTLQLQGKEAEARRIWDGLEQLYRNDPGAADILKAVHRARRAP